MIERRFDHLVATIRQAWFAKIFALKKATKWLGHPCTIEIADTHNGRNKWTTIRSACRGDSS